MVIQVRQSQTRTIRSTLARLAQVTAPVGAQVNLRARTMQGKTQQHQTHLKRRNPQGTGQARGRAKTILHLMRRVRNLQMRKQKKARKVPQNRMVRPILATLLLPQQNPSPVVLQLLSLNHLHLPPEYQCL